MCEYVCSTICVLADCGGQETASDPLKLEFQGAVSHQIDAGNRSQVLCKSNKYS